VLRMVDAHVLRRSSACQASKEEEGGAMERWQRRHHLPAARSRRGLRLRGRDVGGGGEPHLSAPIFSEWSIYGVG
jgi:hypothetical protein